MLRAIIFDMDGVIIDSHPVHKRAWQRFLLSVGRRPTAEELDFVLDGRKREDILRHFLGDLSESQVMEYGNRKEAFFRDEARKVDFISGLPGFLKDVEQAGLPVAIASCGSASRVNFILQKLSIVRYFSAVITGDDVANGKPDPDIFKKAANRLDVPYNDVLVVEDAVSGVLAAKSAGMKCLAIASNGRGQALKKAGADIIAPDFNSIDLIAIRGLFCSSPAG